MWQLAIVSLNVDCLWSRMELHFRYILYHRQSTSKETIIIVTFYKQPLDDGLYVSPKHVTQKRKINE
jgi:hypothetical protein